MKVPAPGIGHLASITARIIDVGTGAILSVFLSLCVAPQGDRQSLERRGGRLAEREAADEAAGPFRISARRERSLKVTSDRHEYRITLGGTADLENTRTRRHATFEIAFQPNLSLAVSNVGTTPVVNPRIVANDRGRWWSIDEMVREITAGAESDTEKALLVWDFVRKNRHHDAPLFGGDELHDPVRMFCAYGGGLCDDAAAVSCALLVRAGIGKKSQGRDPKVRALHGHVMTEAYLGGEYRFLDSDQEAFYLDRENERLVSGDALARDHQLARREHAYGPIFKGWESGERAASLFGSDDGAGFRNVTGHRIDLTLRPGETIIYRWDHAGKYPSEGPRRRSFWANSLLLYEPPLEVRGAKSAADVVSAEKGLAGRSRKAFLVYEVKSPFPLCGGRVRARFSGKADDDRFAVSISTDGKTWNEVWRGNPRGGSSCAKDLDGFLKGRDRRADYSYLVRVSLGSSKPGSARLERFVLESDLMTSAHFAPGLRLGGNRIVYTDETKGPRAVEITHRWRESGNVRPPAPPEKPLFPEPDSVVRASVFEFRWPANEAAGRYHIQVSRRPDMKLPFRTSFDMVVDRPSHGSPFQGMFSPDTDYYWRVRVRNKAGLWGTWSPIWKFRWDGPRVPVGLHYKVADDGRIVISWKPNPRGPRPAAYEVHGSDERGFSLSRKPRTIKGLGLQEATLAGRTTSTEFRVVDPGADRPGMNRCYYRVVAVDARETSSGPSDYVELPHPYVYTPPPAARVGEKYRFALRTLRSLGDLQNRYSAPRIAYWEREAYRYRLERAPDWLAIDPESGVLSGTPGKGDEGNAEIDLVVTRRYPHEVKSNDRRERVFQKTGPEFQASRRHRFTIRVWGAR